MAAPVIKGGPPFFSPLTRAKAVTGLTAKASGNQSNGTLITGGINNFTTVATSGDSAVLPPTTPSNGVPGWLGAQGLVIVNNGAAALAIFPAVGDKINGQAANASILLAPGGIATLSAYAANNWCSEVSYGGATLQATVAASPGSISSTTMQMLGLNQTITPIGSTRLFLQISGDVTQTTTADGAKWQLSWGTGAAPANAAALTGTQVGSNPTMTFLTGVLTVPFCSQAIISGLTPGTAYWVDLALAAVTGGAASMTNMSVSAYEV